jgi:hypothetical protein
MSELKDALGGSYSLTITDEALAVALDSAWLFSVDVWIILKIHPRSVCILR